MAMARRTNLKNAVALRAALECDLEPLRMCATKLVGVVLASNTTIRAAAKELGVGCRTIERMLEDGQVKAPR